jgi:hypothetical protein
MDQIITYIPQNTLKVMQHFSADPYLGIQWTVTVTDKTM